MNFQVVEDCLTDILHVIRPLNEDGRARFQIIKELRQVISSEIPGYLSRFRGATIEPVGLYVSNLFTRSGDLDISIELYNGLFISSSGENEKRTLLRRLMRTMKRQGYWDKFQLINQAGVRILKVESDIENISCYISIDNLLTRMKSKFLCWISEIDTRFHYMVLLVKEWARAQDINNPKAGTFSSYSLCLLVVFHFQTCQPAIFPPLRDIYRGNIAVDLQGARVDAVNWIEGTCIQNIARFRSNRRRAFNRSSLSELFIAFLAKFTDIGAWASDRGICPFTGQWEYIRSNMRGLPQNHAIYINDPFERPENSARAVKEGRQLARISEAFRSSHRRLLSANRNSNSVLALTTLAQNKTAQLIPRGNVGGNHHQQRANYPGAPVQPLYRPPPQRRVDPNAPVEVRCHKWPNVNHLFSSRVTIPNQAYDGQSQTLREWESQLTTSQPSSSQELPSTPSRR